MFLLLSDMIFIWSDTKVLLADTEIVEYLTIGLFLSDNATTQSLLTQTSGNAMQCNPWPTKIISWPFGSSGGPWLVHVTLKMDIT